MIGIKGIRFSYLALKRDDATGKLELTGTYQLISTVDTVLATQTINGYNEIKYHPSVNAHAAINNMVETVTHELATSLGLT